MRISDWSSDVCSSDLISMMKGIEFRFNADFRGITKGDDGSLTVEMTGHDPITVDCVMFATGRVPNTGGLGLDKAGVEWDAKGAIVVDEDRSEEHTSELQSLMRTSYAVFCLTKKKTKNTA